MSRCRQSKAAADRTTPLADIFKADPKFTENEEKYSEIKREILGDSDDEDSDAESGSEDEDDEDENDGIGGCLLSA